jgi:hypothetical protein
VKGVVGGVSSGKVGQKMAVVCVCVDSVEVAEVGLYCRMKMR